MNDTLRDGRYVVMRTLGEGSQGATLEAIDKREGRIVAIKRFEVKSASAWKDVELAEREARVLASLTHPRLPAYVEHFEEAGALYLVIERIDGVSLLEYRKGGGTLGEDDVVRLLETAAGVLGYLHGRTPPIIHRDLKPGNVLRKPDGSFAFVDFGAVRDRLRPEGGSTIVGTFGYMAPEQFQGRAVPASDVYALGATAMWMLTGMQPESLPHKGLGIDVVAALGRRASPKLVTLLARMLEPDPEKRAANIGPLLPALRDRGRPPMSERPAPAPPLSAPPSVPAGDAFPDNVLRLVGRFLPLLWVFSALVWWWLPFRSAMGFTMGLIVLSIVTKKSRAQERRPRVRFHRAPRVPGVRVHAEERRTRVGEYEDRALEDAHDAHERRRKR